MWRIEGKIALTATAAAVLLLTRSALVKNRHNIRGTCYAVFHAVVEPRVLS